MVRIPRVGLHFVQPHFNKNNNKNLGEYTNRGGETPSMGREIMDINLKEIKEKINEWRNREWRWKGKGKIEIKFICLIERAESFRELVDNLEIIISEYEKIKQLIEDEDINEIAVQKELDVGTLYQVKVKKFDCKRDFLMIYHKDKYKSVLFDKFVYCSNRMSLTKL